MGRFLRSYQRMAQQEHWCDRCCTYIQPGELYEARVEIVHSGLSKTGRALLVWKNHIEPGCEYPDPPDWEDKSDEEFDDGQFELPKAA